MRFDVGLPLQDVIDMFGYFWLMLCSQDANGNVRRQQQQQQLLASMEKMQPLHRIAMGWH